MSLRNLDVHGHTVELYEAGDGQPLLYLHGIADMHGAAAEPFPFHTALAEQFRLLAPAHPGCVGSDEDQTMESIDDLVFHTLEVMDALGLDRTDIVGNCVGGWLAAEIAVRNPERVNRLVTIGAPGLFVADAPVTDLFMMVQPRSGGIADLRSTLFADGDGALALDMFPDQHRDKQQGMLRYKVFRFLARFGFQPPYFYHPKLADRLYRFRGPALVLHGTKDAFVSPSHAEAYGAGLPAATVETIEGGHALTLEAPEAVAEKVVSFLGD